MANAPAVARSLVSTVTAPARKRPANAALTTVCLLQVGVTLVTNGRQGPTLDRVQWALLVAMLLTGAWFFHERRVLDRDLDGTVGQVADPNGQR